LKVVCSSSSWHARVDLGVGRVEPGGVALELARMARKCLCSPVKRSTGAAHGRSLRVTSVAWANTVSKSPPDGDVALEARGEGGECARAPGKSRWSSANVALELGEEPSCRSARVTKRSRVEPSRRVSGIAR
jgi:hypothetical protein